MWLTLELQLQHLPQLVSPHRLLHSTHLRLAAERERRGDLIHRLHTQFLTVTQPTSGSLRMKRCSASADIFLHQESRTSRRRPALCLRFSGGIHAHVPPFYRMREWKDCVWWCKQQLQFLLRGVCRGLCHRGVLCVARFPALLQLPGELQGTFSSKVRATP